ncbi:MAG: tRNA lysidine(34) synthetase TilS [Planctomycetes bacterium]|nr:tRNA lysidine(34) synthetase TilS [Planctomycetota bacterium]
MVQQPFAAAMERLIRRPDRAAGFIAALSGGMDSVVLLHLLAAWRHRVSPSPPLLAAHLNHGLRGREAEGDLVFCREYARSLGVEVAEETVDTARFAAEERLGLEEAGRVLRYRFFHRVATETGSLVITGHHADDQAETILLHLRRGAHRRGLSGMAELAPVTVPPGLRLWVGRPLLTLGREQLQAYAVAAGLAWREDASNRDHRFARNRIRHRILPTLEALVPGFRDRLLARAEALGREEAYLVDRGRHLAAALVWPEHGGRFLSLTPDAMDDPEVFAYVLRQVVEEELGSRLPYGAVLSRLAELATAGCLGETVSLPSRLRVRKERDGLFFFYDERLAAANHPSDTLLPDPPFRVLVEGLEVTAEWLPTGGRPPAADQADPEVEWLEPTAIRWPLRLRPPRPGERFRPLNAPGSRKIQDILVDVKSPRRARRLARVLADHAGALWIWPYRLGHRARLKGPSNRALRVRIREVRSSGM